MCYSGSAIGPEEEARQDEPAYSNEGVDLTLIRWMLSMTPAERLQVLQDFIDSVSECGGQQARGGDLS